MAQTFDQQVDEIRALLLQRLRARGRSLAVQTRKAGRQLPRPVRRDLAFLVQAEGLMHNPKLARMVDANRIDTAHRNAIAYLQTVNPNARRKDMLLTITASIGLGVLVVGVVLLYVLVQRGFV